MPTKTKVRETPPPISVESQRETAAAAIARINQEFDEHGAAVVAECVRTEADFKQALIDLQQVAELKNAARRARTSLGFRRDAQLAPHVATLMATASPAIAELAADLQDSYTQDLDRQIGTASTPDARAAICRARLAALVEVRDKLPLELLDDEQLAERIDDIRQCCKLEG